MSNTCYNFTVVLSYLILLPFPVLDSNIRVDFNRNTGNRDTDNWAVGFTGGLYEASILSSEPFTVGWTFDGQTVEYNVDFSLLMIGDGEYVKTAHNRFVGGEDKC